MHNNFLFIQEMFVRCKLAQKFYTASWVYCERLLQLTKSTVIINLVPCFAQIGQEPTLVYSLTYKCSHQDIEETMTDTCGQTLFAQTLH